MKTQDWAALHKRADAAGMAAGEAARPQPMIVRDVMSGRVYEPVMDGVCGFAYVTVRPGTSAFAKWLKVNARAFKAYYGGVQFSVGAFGQSYERKVAYAKAYVEVVRAEGISAFVESRLD